MDTKKKKGISILILLLMWLIPYTSLFAQQFEINEKEYFEKQGANVLVFSNWYDGLFSDSKMSGIEIIHHGERTATNGDVRLHHTPEQWDAIPTFVKREVDREKGEIEVWQEYPEYDFSYRIKAETRDEGV